MAVLKFYRGVNANLASHKDGLYFTTDLVDGVHKLYFPDGKGNAVAIADFSSEIADIKSDITTLTSVDATQNANITELQNTLTGYSSSSTVKDAIDQINKDIADHGVLSISSTGSSALVVDKSTGNAELNLKVDGSTIKANTNNQLVVGAIAESQVTGLVDDLSKKALQTDVDAINNKIGGNFSSTSTVAAAIEEAKNAGVTSIKVSDTSNSLSVDKSKGDVTVTLAPSTLANASAFTDKYLTKTDGKVTITSSSSVTGILKRYTVKQGTTELGNIDIPKDFLVKSGKIVKGTYDEETGDFEYTEDGDKYIELVINSADSSSTDQKIYIAVQDLVDVYTGGVAITVNDDNSINLAYNTSDKYLTVADNKLATKGIDDAISKAVSDMSISGGATAEAGKYVSAVTASGKSISVTTSALPTLAMSDEQTSALAASTFVTGLSITGSTASGGYKIEPKVAPLPEGASHVGDVVSVSAKNGVKNSGTATAPVLEANLASTTAVTATDAVYNVALNASGNLVVNVAELAWIDC